MRNYFTLDGVDSRDFGVYISGQGTFNASGRDYNIIPVPGRNGDLVGPEKRFLNGTLTYPAFIYANFKQQIESFRNFLLSLVGYHDLVDSYHPNEIRKVLFEGPFETDVEPKNDAGRFDIEFNCKPQRYLASGNEVTTFELAGETETFSGSIVTFDNPDVATVNALSTAINPIQDLHGYDSPWPAGGGKNKLQTTLTSGSLTGVTYTVNSDGSVKLGGSASANTHIVVGSVALEAGTYTLNGITGSSTATVYLQVTNEAMNQQLAYTANGDKDFTLPEAQTVVFRIVVINGTSPTATIYPMIRLSSVTDATFAPYSNLCPISGWSAVGIEATGVNLCDISTTMIGMAWNYATASNRAALFVRLKYGVQYTLSKSGNGSLDGVYYGYKNEITDNTTWNGGSVSAMSSNSVTVSMPSQTAKYLVVGFNKSNITQADVEAVNLQLETGSTATAFKPYSGNTYTIQFGDTVYGGKLDVTTGVLTVTHANIASYNGESINEPWISSMDAYVAGTTPTTGAQVVYELASPITITLDPVTISAISGQTNNVWANTGDITATIAFPQYQFTITNPTLFDSQPLLRVYGTGILGIGSQQITITQADVYTDIDSEMMDAFKGTANKNPYVQLTDHNFPVFKPGVNNISLGTGITKVEITPRWWIV